MIVGMTLDWSRLKHAYGFASDLPRLFDEIGDPELADEAWDEFWASLYHQRSVYSASFAAVPVLADIATGRKPGGSWQALGLAGRIVVEEQQLHEPGYVQARYPAAINELHQLTQNHVTARPFEGDEDDFLYWLEHLLAFEGVPIWRRNLRRDEYPVVCPSCALSLEIDLSRRLRGTRHRDPNAHFRVVGHEGPILTEVRRAAPRGPATAGVKDARTGRQGRAASGRRPSDPSVRPHDLSGLCVRVLGSGPDRGLPGKAINGRPGPAVLRRLQQMRP